MQLESNGDFLLCHNRVLGVNYDKVNKFVNSTKNCFPFSEEPAKEEGSESHKQNAAGIDS